MPLLHNRLVVNITANLRAFLNVDAGLVRGPAEAAEPKPGGPSALTEEEAARKSALEIHGMNRALRKVGFSEVVSEETVKVAGFPGDGSAPADLALLKGLARGVTGCKYAELGSLREASAANVAEVAEECLSMSQPDEEESVSSPIVEQAVYDSEKGVSYKSLSFGYADLEESFDLVLVRGGRSRESVALDTGRAFEMSKRTGATVVWSGYRSGSGKIHWPTLAGILDGCPPEKHERLRHVSGSSCVMYSERGFAHGGSGGGETFEVKVSAGKAPRRLVVLDDAFPNVQSSFRIAEYNSYLEHWKDAAVYSTASNLISMSERKGFARSLEEYNGVYPGLGERVFQFDGNLDLGGDLAYFIFLKNAFQYLDVLEARGTPFAFTLYPGGGFQLNQKRSDEMLRTVCLSPGFEKVIATQKVTYDYLVDRGFCRPEQVEFVYGGVFPSAYLARRPVEKVRYKEGKDTFDVCFVAYKYTKRSIPSKGYDVFVETAKKLAKRHDDIRFHVVGTFDEDDVDVSEIRERITFHGSQTTDFFPEFYSGMDVILSPNAPFELQPGSFDGFPTGACIEAGLCGVAVFCSDPLDQNIAFEDGGEMVVAPRDAEAVSEAIGRYHDNPDELRELSERGRQAYARVFDIEAQMEPRRRIISGLLGEKTPRP